MPFPLNTFPWPPSSCRENPKFLTIGHKALRDVSPPFFLCPHFPLVVPFTQSTYAVQVFLMFPQHGKHFPTSGPLHLLTSSHDVFLPKPQTTFHAYIRNLFKRCLSMWVSLTMIVFNIRTPSFHHHQILCAVSLLYFMLLSFRITLCFQVCIFRLSSPNPQLECKLQSNDFFLLVYFFFQC